MARARPVWKGEWGVARAHPVWKGEWLRGGARCKWEMDGWMERWGLIGNQEASKSTKGRWRNSRGGAKKERGGGLRLWRGLGVEVWYSSQTPGRPGACPKSLSSAIFMSTNKLPQKEDSTECIRTCIPLNSWICVL